MTGIVLCRSGRGTQICVQREVLEQGGVSGAIPGLGQSFLVPQGYTLLVVKRVSNPSMHWPRLVGVAMTQTATCVLGLVVSLQHLQYCLAGMCAQGGVL